MWDLFFSWRRELSRYSRFFKYKISPNKSVGGNISWKTSKNVRPFSPKTKKFSSKQGRVGGKNFHKKIRVLHLYSELQSIQYQHFRTLHIYKLYSAGVWRAQAQLLLLKPTTTVVHFLVSCFSVLTERGPTVCFFKLSRQIQNLRRIVFMKNFVKVSLIFYTFIDVTM